MKKLSKKLIIACLTISLGFCACQTQKVNLVFDGSKYRTDENYFRASASGTSPNLDFAKDIASRGARDQIAADIRSIIESVGGKVTEQRNKGKGDQKDQKIELEQLHKKIELQIVENVISGTALIGEEAFRDKKTGNYTYHVAYELNKDNVLKSTKSAISSNLQLNEIYDKLGLWDELKKSLTNSERN